MKLYKYGGKIRQRQSHDQTLVNHVHDVLSSNMSNVIKVNAKAGIIWIHSISTDTVHELRFERIK